MWTKRCAKTGSQRPEIHLVWVFISEFYRGKQVKNEKNENDVQITHILSNLSRLAMRLMLFLLICLDLEQCASACVRLRAMHQLSCRRTIDRSVAWTNMPKSARSTELMTHICAEFCPERSCQTRTCMLGRSCRASNRPTGRPTNEQPTDRLTHISAHAISSYFFISVSICRSVHM